MTPQPLPADRVACRISIRGIVQGVGFRPFVFRAALRHRIAGWVLNGEAGVEIHAEGAANDVEAFLDELRSNPPPAARISLLEFREAAPEGHADFQIRVSRRDSSPTVRISPDLAVCDACLAEMNDPADRRHRYPYINCTNCGPRYSIITRLPYDRPGTTMAAWALCDVCRQEYEDPLNRRHHAQPTACKLCGPGYRLYQGGEYQVDEYQGERAPDESRPSVDGSEQAIRRTAELLREGKILGIKGIGGYHLTCDARNVAAVAALRARKYRKEKPFALLVRTLDEARELVELTAAHERLLLDVARPIVLAHARVDLPEVAPDNASLGVMLPYAPLHHLLFDCGAPSPLVLTSGNASSEPIAYRDDDARSRLAGIADAYLIGERPIARRIDDSVIAVRAGKPFMFRRSRGYAPSPVCQLPPGEPILALGSDLKNSIALVVHGQVFVSQYIGDLGDYETDVSFEETVRDLLAMYEIKPDELTVAHDLHPQFASTRFAERLPARRRVAVQHHHAHIASVLAEHHLLDEQVVGVAFDGTGYGTDGSIWGGEVFAGGIRNGFERCAALRPVRMPGGDAAARFPVQAAAGFLAGLSDLPDLTGPPFLLPRRFVDATALVNKNVRCSTCSSMGRLFDAAAALSGFIREASFEGQAAIWLEHQARQCPGQAPYPFPDLNHGPLLRAVIEDRLAGRDVAEIASSFHAAVAAATAEQVRQLCRQRSIDGVALSGGVFQNELLLNSLLEELERDGLHVWTNQQVPVNDGGICVGQAALCWGGLPTYRGEG